MDAMDRPLEEQIGASLAGDKDAFGRIVARYQGLVCSVAYSLTGDLGTSEDLAQETFITAWQRLGQLRDGRKLPAWLCGIARNLACNSRRRQARDPLRQAGELSPEQPAPQNSAAEQLSQAEREALVWRTLEAIAEDYREPLILFYREGQSVRAVAEALDISEDNARQRLARGRKMLKEQVAQIVEDSLRETRPGAVFTLAVLAALPVATAQAAVAGGIGSGAALGKGSAGASLGAVAGAGMLGGLVGSLIGMTGGFFGMWASIRNSPTLRARRHMLVCGALTYSFVWLFLGYQGLCGMLSWRRPALMIGLCSVGWVLYIPLLFLLIVWTNRVAQRILEEDLGRRPAPAAPLEQSWLSRRRVWLALAWGLPPAALGSAGVVLWIYSMPWARGAWVVFAGLALLSHALFVALFRWGMRVAHDEQSFAAHPPACSAAERLALMTGAGRPARGPSAKALFYNDLAALAGSIFGPMAPLIAMSVQQGDVLTACLIGVIASGVLVATMALRPVLGRRLAFFWECIFMGGFSFAVMALKWHGWTAAGVLRLPEFFGAWSGAIPLALYWCMAFVTLYTIPKEKAW